MGRDRFLGLLERQLAQADELVEHILKLIFHMGIERLGHVGLGPQVADGVGTTKFEAYQVVNFILTGLMRSDPIGPVYQGFHTLRHILHSLGIARRADNLGVGGQDITRRQCWGKGGEPGRRDQRKLQRSPRRGPGAIEAVFSFFHFSLAERLLVVYCTNRQRRKKPASAGA